MPDDYGSHTIIASDVDDSEISATITVTVPYNFTNTATISLGEIAYAGENIKISNTLTVSPRRNNVTNGTYATIEEEPELRLYTYSASSDRSGDGEKRGYGNYNSNICSQLQYNRGNCTNVKSYTRDYLNEDASIYGKTYTGYANVFDDGSSSVYNIYDVPAGEYFCAVITIFPYTVNSNTDTDMTSHNHSWYISKPACKVVNKKPSFQIWGGDVFSSGNINAKSAQKNVLNGYIAYTAQSEANKTIFGSWAEFGVFASGANNFLSSGAATGYNRNEGGTLIFDPGGNKTGPSGIYCKNSPLTIMNKNCKSNDISGPGGANMVADTSSKTEIYNSLIVKAKTTEPRPAGTMLDLINNYTTIVDQNQNIRYTYVEGDAYVYASQVMPTGVTHVVYATGSIILGQGLQYSEGPYTNLAQVPQYIFYAGKDINIEYNVARVDGWLIAEGTVNTCTAGTTLIGTNDAKANLQLKINGAVVAEKINFGRSYGASTGLNSGVPAEIINLNITHFLWSNSNTSSKPTLRIVYTKELAPRF